MAANEQRLQTYFSAALDRALGTYVANRSTIVMPAAEVDVEAEHVQLASWAQEVLTGTVKELTDTDAFGEARRRFDLAMREGLQQVKEKNIEVWKAYSDEATRCAVAANRAREKQCSIFCLFNNVPLAHQATSRRHLMDCLTKSAVGSRMAAPLQAQVFEAWYKKDMGYDSQRVRMRFYSLLVTMAALAFGAWWRLRRRAITYEGYDFYGQPQPCYYNQAPSSGYFASQQGVYGVQSRAAAHAATCTPMQAAPKMRFGVWRGGA